MSHVISSKQALADRIRLALDASPLTVVDIAGQMGISRQTLTRYASGAGGDPSALAVSQIAQICGVSPGWLLTGKGSPAGDALDASLVNVPVVDVRLGAGSAGFWSDGGAVVRRVGLPEAWLRGAGIVPSQAFLAQVFGRSMEGTISDGDVVVGERTTMIDRDAIYAVTVNDEAFIKRVQRVPPRGGVRLRLESDNEAFAPIEVYESDHLDVIGRVVRKVVVA